MLERMSVWRGWKEHKLQKQSKKNIPKSEILTNSNLTPLREPLQKRWRIEGSHKPVINKLAGLLNDITRYDNFPIYQTTTILWTQNKIGKLLVHLRMSPFFIHYHFHMFTQPYVHMSPFLYDYPLFICHTSIIPMVIVSYVVKTVNQPILTSCELDIHCECPTFVELIKTSDK